MQWLTITLICAFALASADAGTKAWLRDYSARELTLIRFAIAGLMMLPIALAQPFPHLPPPFWGWIAALLPLEIAAMLLYMRAIRDHPLSLTLPYLAFTPVFVVLTGNLVLGEQVSAKGFGGILLVVSGAWLLNVEHASRDDWRSWGRPLRAILYDSGSRTMLLVAFLYSLTSVLGKGAMRYMAPELFGPFYFGLLGVVTAFVFGLMQPRILLRVWRRTWAVLAVAAVFGIMVITHFIALQQVEVAYMIAVKRTSLLFGILYGATFFHERGLSVHLFAGALMIAGVFLIAM